MNELTFYLEKYGQLHLLEKIASSDSILRQMKSFVIPQKMHKRKKAPQSFCAEMQNKRDAERGKALLKQGKAACVLLAAGHGSRLGFEGPKGCFPISLVKKKTIFQLFAEKIQALTNQIGTKLDLAIMCSFSNLKATQDFFSKENFFGLKENIHFFCQRELPLTDLSGKWFLDREGKIATGPDGNGSFYSSFYDSLFPLFKKKGIEHVFIVPVDNPLADPFSASFLGYHDRKQNEVSAVGVEFENATDKMGIWVENSGKPEVFEYIDFDLDEIQSLIARKKIFANVNLFLLNLSFVEKAAKRDDFPYLQANKEFEGKKILKWERFLFDAFVWTDKIGVVSYPKASCYAPLKTVSSIVEVQKALKQKDLEIIKEITQKTPASLNLELDLSFHYPTQDLLRKWRGKELFFEQDTYIE